PGMDGLQLQQEVARLALPIATIVMTGNADVPLAVRAIKAGAFHFIEKPINFTELFELLPRAFDLAQEKFEALDKRRRARELLDTLTPRELEVARLVALGQSNKATANDLSLSHRTVEVHRAKVMDKLKTPSVAALVRLMQDAGADTMSK
ncbi:MAG: response regulator transcription factor, partial [Alphaproteobacteria bacterium]|nr:response regulator transcription factor [Alphaproteobacteria bacterium]